MLFSNDGFGNCVCITLRADPQKSSKSIEAHKVSELSKILLLRKIRNSKTANFLIENTAPREAGSARLGNPSNSRG
jgi:hypothetical protein